MADAITLARVKKRLEQLTEQTPRDAAYWDTVAQGLVHEIERTITVSSVAAPSESFVALTVNRQKEYRAIAKAQTQPAVIQLASDYLLAQPEAEVWIVEIKRGLTAS